MGLYPKKKQDAKKDLAKYVVGTVGSKFIDEEDVVLFNQVKVDVFPKF